MVGKVISGQDLRVKVGAKDAVRIRIPVENGHAVTGNGRVVQKFSLPVDGGIVCVPVGQLVGEPPAGDREIFFRIGNAVFPGTLPFVEQGIPELGSPGR